jgi:hypothetical protein
METENTMKLVWILGLLALAAVGVMMLMPSGQKGMTADSPVSAGPLRAKVPNGFGPLGTKASANPGTIATFNTAIGYKEGFGSASVDALIEIHLAAPGKEAALLDVDAQPGWKLEGDVDGMKAMRYDRLGMRGSGVADVKRRVRVDFVAKPDVYDDAAAKRLALEVLKQVSWDEKGLAALFAEDTAK